MMITIDDSFIKMLSETLTTKLSAIELSTMDALNQSIPAPSRRRSSATRCRSRASTAPSRICRGAQDFDNNMGHYVHGFVRDTTASDGVLAQYLALMQQERMREQSKQASKLIVNIQSKLEQITAQSQQLMNNSIRASGKVQTQSTLTQGVALVIAITIAILVAYTSARPFVVRSRSYCEC